MKFRLLIIVCVLLLVISFHDVATAYGYNFIFPSLRRSAVSGYTYADPDNPSHLAWDYRFAMHTPVTSAQKGWVATSYWAWNDTHESDCDGDIDDRGNYIILNHTSDDRTEGTGLESWYFHLSNTGNQPAAGAYFHLGETMANSGDTGCGAAHLHFATKNNGVPFDPYAGTTNWVSGEPIPMGFRDQNGVVQGPFSLSNAKIRDKWLALEGSPGSPIENMMTDICYFRTANGVVSANLYAQGFERGMIHYCGSGSAVYTPYQTELYFPDVRGRLTCEMGVDSNSFIWVENVGYDNAQVSIAILKPDGTVLDTRVHPSLSPGEQWEINVHTIVFDWLILGSNNNPTPGIFSGSAMIYSDMPLAYTHGYSSPAGCANMPNIIHTYPPP